jgi:hypothetical protein
VIPSFWCMRCRASPPPKFFILYFPDSIHLVISLPSW